MFQVAREKDHLKHIIITNIYSKTAHAVPE